MICGDCVMQRLLGLEKIMYVHNNMVSENFQQYNLERKITQRYAYINLVLRVSKVTYGSGMYCWAKGTKDSMTG